MASVIDATTNLESENRSNSDDEATREKDLALELSNRRDEIGTIPEEVETSVEQNRYSALAAPRIPKSPGLSISIARKMHIEHDIQLPPSAHPSSTPNPLRAHVGVQSPSDCFDNLDETRDSFSDLGPNSYFASSSVIGEYSSDDATESVGSESPSRDAIHHHVFSPTSSEGGDQYSHVGKNLFGKLWKRQFPKAHHASEGGIYRSISGDHLTSVLIPNPAPDSSTPEDSDQGILSPPSGRGSETEPFHLKSKHHHGHGLFDIFRHNRMEAENSGHSLNRDSKARRKKSAEDSNTLKRNPHSSDQIKNFNHEDDHSYEQLKSRKNSKADSRNLFENIFHPDHHKRESSDDSSGSSSAIHHSGAHIHTHISQREFDEHKKKESVSRRSRGSASHNRNASDASLDKYGYKDSVIGKGGQATIRLVSVFD